jgi:hypothetical protein
MRRLWLLAGLLLTGAVHAQPRSDLAAWAGEAGIASALTALPAVDDTVRRDPDVALRRSLLAPGWGQLYNGDAYKTPFVWGGLVAFTGLAIYNEREYRRFQRVVRYVQLPEQYPEYADEAAPYVGLSDNSLIAVRNSFRRSRDLSVVGFGLWYALTALDAHVSAHLSDFDADPNFRLTFDPTAATATVRLDVRF